MADAFYPPRVVALEEHLAFPDLTARVPLAARQAAGWSADPYAAQLADVGAERLALMDAAGITVQVLSVYGPGAELLPPAEGPAFAREYNDRLAAAAAQHPDRFRAFAHLPLTNPEAAAEELARCVREHRFVGALLNGTTQGKFLDAPEFAPLLARAEALGVPLYLHPGIPPAPVRAAYYSHLPGELDERLATAGYGWHAETAIHVLRLIFSGSLEKYPRLKLLIGHLGETLPYMLARIDMTVPQQKTHLPRTVAQTLREQVHITTSGMFTRPPFETARATVGLDNLLFSVDYPYAPNQAGQQFLAGLDLAPAELLQLASGNADRLLGL